MIPNGNDPQQILDATEAAVEAFNAIGGEEFFLATHIHPDASSALTPGSLNADFSTLLNPGLAPVPKVVEDLPDAVVFSIFEGVTETGQVTDGRTPPRALVMRHSGLDNAWKLFAVRSLT